YQRDGRVCQRIIGCERDVQGGPERLRTNESKDATIGCGELPQTSRTALQAELRFAISSGRILCNRVTFCLCRVLRMDGPVISGAIERAERESRPDIRRQIL